MGIKFSNFGKALVASAPSGTTGLSFTVEAGKGLLFPALAAGDYFYGVFKDASGNREIVKVAARSTDSMTIAVGGRGLDGTTARTWAAGDYFVAGMVNIAIEESLSNDNLNAIANLSSGVDTMAYFTGAGTAELTGLSAFGRSLINDANSTGAHLTLGTQALIDASLGASVLGMGQTWQNLTASRASGVTYTNSTGRTIQVSAWSVSSGVVAYTVDGRINGSSIDTQKHYANGAGYSSCIHLTVPSGATYGVNFTSCALLAWKELR